MLLFMMKHFYASVVDNNLHRYFTDEHIGKGCANGGTKNDYVCDCDIERAPGKEAKRSFNEGYMA